MQPGPAFARNSSQYSGRFKQSGQQRIPRGKTGVNQPRSELHHLKRLNFVVAPQLSVSVDP